MGKAGNIALVSASSAGSIWPNLRGRGGSEAGDFRLDLPAPAGHHARKRTGAIWVCRRGGRGKVINRTDHTPLLISIYMVPAEGVEAKLGNDSTCRNMHPSRITIDDLALLTRQCKNWF